MLQKQYSMHCWNREEEEIHSTEHEGKLRKGAVHDLSLEAQAGGAVEL